MPRWHVPYHVQYRNNAHRDAVAKLPSDPADRAQAERDLHSAGTSLYAAYQQLLAQFPDEVHFVTSPQQASRIA